jgi:hypothetical protein
MTACAGGNGSTTGSTGTTGGTAKASTVNVTLTDAPPAGVAVLSFEVTINSAMLEPGDVPLFSKGHRVELTQLQAQTAFLDSKSVPAGTYSSLVVSFSNPELTFTNNTGATLAGCAVGATCEISPAVGQSPFTYTGAPFPLTIAADSPLGLQVDFDLANSIQSDLSVNPVLNVTQVAAPPMGQGHGQDIDDVVGKVTAVDTTNNTITIQSGGSSGNSTTFSVDSNTAYKNFTDASLTNAFSSVAVGQMLRADLKLQAGGSLLASVVQLLGTEQEEQDGDIEGLIIAVDSPTEFKMVVHCESPDVTTTDVGNVLTVTINSGATFTKDDLNLTIPSGVQFASSADMMAGQRVRIIPSGPVASGAVSTSAIRLLASFISGRVAAISGANITIDTLPAIFSSVTPAVTSIQVDTSTLTHFENVTDITGLAVGDQISVAGPLFQGTPPVLAARNVRKRQ